MKRQRMEILERESIKRKIIRLINIGEMKAS